MIVRDKKVTFFLILLFVYYLIYYAGQQQQKSDMTCPFQDYEYCGRLGCSEWCYCLWDIFPTKPSELCKECVSDFCLPSDVFHMKTGFRRRRTGSADSGAVC